MKRLLAMAAFVGGSGLALVAPAISASAVATASMLGNPCAGCHGPDGVSVGSAPSLRGYPKEVIVSAMKAFRDDKRPSTIMGRISKGYTDEEIEALGGFFSGDAVAR